MAATLAAISAILAVVGALLTWRAAATTIRDNIDEFMGDLARQGRWYNRAAIVIFAAAILNLLATGVPLLIKG